MDELINAVIENPWQGVGYYADSLGRDKSNTRRDLKKLVGHGELSGRKEADGIYSFGPSNGGASLPMAGPAIKSKPTPYQPSYSPPPSSGPIDGEFTVVSDTKAGGTPPIYQPPANGPVRHTMPWDALGCRWTGSYTIWRRAIRDPALATALTLSTVDPDGSGVVGEWINKSREQAAYAAGWRDSANQQAAKQIVVPAERKPTKWELAAIFGGSLLKTIAVVGDDARRQSAETPRKIKALPVLIQNQFADEGRLDGDGEQFRRSDEPLPEDFDDSELEEIDARARTIVEDEPDEPPPNPPVRQEGRVSPRIDPQQIWRLTASERLAAARRDAAKDVLAERPRPPRSLRQILGTKEIEPEPVQSRWARWFGKQKKAIWR